VPPQPPYSGTNVEPAYQLRYTRCAWPSGERLPSLSTAGWESLKNAWELDGLRLLEAAPSPSRLLVTFSARPTVSPVFLATRAKGRLQYAYRTVDKVICRFSRKVSVRSVGENTTGDVRRYIGRQVPNEPELDPRLRELLTQFTVDRDVDLAAPSETLSGRYWYNLHIVLVAQGRHRIVDEGGLALLRDPSFRIAEAKGYVIASLSVMPDHLHVALRGNVEHSPHEIALSFQNNLSYALGRGKLWQESYDVGTFGEYTMGAIRKVQRGA
jgi:REP element-mobilizing transposase RayT